VSTRFVDRSSLRESLPAHARVAGAATVAILGAGAMGTAFATPLRRAGHRVRLWGTHLDTEIVHQLRAGRPHPRTAERLSPGVSVLDHRHLAAALKAADLVAIAIASEGVQFVVEAAAQRLEHPRAVLLMSKGFALHPNGRVELLTESVERILAAHGLAVPVVAVGGPCKANEVAAGRPTVSVYAATELDLAVQVARELSTVDYRIVPDDDVTGLEVAAALKNVYAVALGICDGLADLGGQPWHDLKAAVFAQAVEETSILVGQLGGRPATAIGLAGVGDLEVTGLSGRNRVYGERIGRGESPRDAISAMSAENLTVESQGTAGFARRIVEERGGRSCWARLPLLDALTRGIDAGEFDGDLGRILTEAAMPPYPPAMVADGPAQFARAPRRLKRPGE
jgi:glycerol-3-phosphate dehydrogenase (NAD(P)+)